MGFLKEFFKTFEMCKKLKNRKSLQFNHLKSLHALSITLGMKDDFAEKELRCLGYSNGKKMKKPPSLYSCVNGVVEGIYCSRPSTVLANILKRGGHVFPLPVGLLANHVKVAVLRCVPGVIDEFIPLEFHSGLGMFFLEIAEDEDEKKLKAKLQETWDCVRQLRRRLFYKNEYTHLARKPKEERLDVVLPHVSFRLLEGTGAKTRKFRDRNRQLRSRPSYTHLGSNARHDGFHIERFLIQAHLKKEKISIVMVGLKDAGKTTILSNLQLGNIISRVPIMGINVESCEYQNGSFTVWDLGGHQDKDRPLLRHYLQNKAGLIFVVDSSDHDHILEAKTELHGIILNEDLRNVRLLVFANKHDGPNSMSTTELTNKLGLSSLPQGFWHIERICTLTGEGVLEGIKWLCNNTPDKA